MRNGCNRNGIQMITTSLTPGGYESIEVEAGTPVKWTIQAGKGSIYGCNNRIFIPEYGIEKKLEEGDNIIEFTPKEEGVFSYSCWMGMLRSTKRVISLEEYKKVALCFICL